MKRVLCLLVVAALATGAAFGQVVTGEVDSGLTAIEVARVIGSGWQVGGGACNTVPLIPRAPEGSGTDTRARLDVVQLTENGCQFQQIQFVLTVEGGVLTKKHCYSIKTPCNVGSGQLIGEVIIEPKPPGDCIPRNVCPAGQECFFDDGDINVRVLPSKQVPALGAWGAGAVVVGLLGIGVFVLVRRLRVD